MGFSGDVHIVCDEVIVSRADSMKGVVMTSRDDEDIEALAKAVGILRDAFDASEGGGHADQ